MKIRFQVDSKQNNLFTRENLGTLGNILHVMYCAVLQRHFTVLAYGDLVSRVVDHVGGRTAVEVCRCARNTC